MTPAPASGGRLPREIVQDRDAFVAAIPATRTRPTREQCAGIVDDLIKWSQQEHPAIVFTQRVAKRKQHFVTYSFPDGNTFWQAFPHEEDGARLYVTGSKRLPESVRTRLQDQFAEMSMPRGPKTEVHPTIAFGDMLSAEDRRVVLELLGEALASVAGTPG